MSEDEKFHLGYVVAGQMPKKPQYSVGKEAPENQDLSALYQEAVQSYFKFDLRAGLPGNSYDKLSLGGVCEDGCTGICALCNDRKCFDQEVIQQD